MTEYSVTERLPDNGSRVLCFGHLTYCCTIDMDEEPDWHEVTFRLDVTYYELKKSVPQNPEESILESFEVLETWFIGEESLDGHILGVTKWKKIEPKETK